MSTPQIQTPTVDDGKFAPGDDIVLAGTNLEMVTNATFYKQDGKTELYTVSANANGKGTEVSTNRRNPDNLGPQRVKLAVFTNDSPPVYSNKVDVTFVNA
ncbi:hypothetical protein [Streptomyces sp. LS1784]|uniref:hypothetical protein n=1 Tax=Streptomyces sp. LS1784 TaxID=2851533 RepID=UPI001CCF9FE1|nr:hypothetical protein [Streptomyces sp. LS1784]